MFNSQCSILIRKEKCDLVLHHLAIRHPLRTRIEHWELSIGQIPGRISGQRILPSYFCASPKPFQGGDYIHFLGAAFLSLEGGTTWTSYNVLKSPS